jgi:hypothetical protein
MCVHGNHARVLFNAGNLEHLVVFIAVVDVRAEVFKQPANSQESARLIHSRKQLR